MAPRLDLQAVVRPNILSMKTYAPPNANKPKTTKILLDKNENPLGSCLAPASTSCCSTPISSDDEDLVVAFPLDADMASLLFAQSMSLHRYPSPSMPQLKQRILAWRGLSPESAGKLTLGVGAVELIDLLMRVTCIPSEDAILVTPPTFPLYQIRAAVNDVTVFESPMRLVEDDFCLHVPEILEILAQNERIKLVFLPTPGNPTGSMIPLQQIEEILKSPVYKGLVVVDEAYIDFCPEPMRASALQLIDQYPNLVVLQTLSKSHGLAGIRLGMAYAHESLTQMLQRVQVPFSIASPTATLAMLALSETYSRNHRNAMVQIAEYRESLVDAMQTPEFASLQVGPPVGGSAANFVLLPVWSKDGMRLRDNRRAKWACEVLSSEFDIAIGYVGEMNGCEGCLRVGVGTPQENRKLIEDMQTVFRRG